MKLHLSIIYGLIIILAVWMCFTANTQNMHMRKTIELYKAINFRDSVGMNYVDENTVRWNRQYRLDSSIYVKLKTLYDIENSRK